MNLIINNPDNLDLKDFSNWLIIKIQGYLKDIIDEDKLINWNNYLNTNIKIKFNNNEKRILSSKEILISGAYNLISKNENNKVIIEINPNSIIPNTFAKFINIISLINYGNLIVKAYPVYDDLFNYFADNLDTYYNQYLKER